MAGSEREELYRRLEQSRRLAGAAGDSLTKERLTKLVSDIEHELAAAEARDSDAPPT